MTIALTLMLFLLANQRQPSTAAQEVEQLVHKLASTWKSGDCEGWGAIVAPEWSVTHINGVVMTRPEVLRMCKAPDAPLLDLRSEGIAVRLFGDAAVVTGRTIASVGGEKPATITLRFTDVFIRRDGKWQAVASHATELKP